jgi:hypothetical protein
VASDVDLLGSCGTLRRQDGNLDEQLVKFAGRHRREPMIRIGDGLGQMRHDPTDGPVRRHASQTAAQRRAQMNGHERAARCVERRVDVCLRCPLSMHARRERSARQTQQALPIVRSEHA